CVQAQRRGAACRSWRALTGAAVAPSMRGLRRASGVFFQESNRTAPGEIGRLLVVTGLVRVVVESVVDALIDVKLVGFVGGFQRILVIADVLVVFFIETDIVQ